MDTDGRQYQRFEAIGTLFVILSFEVPRKIRPTVWSTAYSVEKRKEEKKQGHRESTKHQRLHTLSMTSPQPKDERRFLSYPLFVPHSPAFPSRGLFALSV